MRQKIRRTMILLSLLLFPLTLNFFSPYVSIDGAMSGIISGSLLVFGLQFVSGIFLGRAWCGWLCPVSGLSEACLGINSRNVNTRKLKIIRYAIFSVWAAILLTMFFLAGGIKGIDPLHLTKSGISVDAPQKYIIYYSVLLLLFLLTILIGKRGACHSICWMSPFLVGGMKLGRLLKAPQLKLFSTPAVCIRCGACDKACPMSIAVSASVQAGSIRSTDCILCGVCVETCKKGVLRYGMKR